MAMVGEILFSGDVAHDTFGGTVAIAAATTNKMRFTEKTVRGVNYTVLSQPQQDSVETRAYPIWTTPSITDVSEWSVEVLCNVPYTGSLGAIFSLPNGQHIRISGANIDAFGGTVPCPKNKWFLFTLRHSTAGSDAYIDDVKVADIASENWASGNEQISAYSSSMSPNPEIAFIRLYDHVLDVPTSVSVPADDNNSGNLLGAVWKEEVDGGSQNLISVVGDDGIDIAFSGVACWGGLQGLLYNNNYTKIAATISWDAYIIGTGHIGPRFSLLEIHSNQTRNDYIARLVCECSLTTGVVTGVYAEVYNDLNVRQSQTLIASTAIPATSYACEIEITEDDVKFTFGENEVTLSRTFTAYDEYLIGMNLGMHFGPAWNMQIRGVEYHQSQVQSGSGKGKYIFFRTFNKGIFGGKMR